MNARWCRDLRKARLRVRAGEVASVFEYNEPSVRAGARARYNPGEIPLPEVRFP